LPSERRAIELFHYLWLLVKFILRLYMYNRANPVRSSPRPIRRCRRRPYGFYQHTATEDTSARTPVPDTSRLGHLSQIARAADGPGYRRLAARGPVLRGFLGDRLCDGAAHSEAPLPRRGPPRIVRTIDDRADGGDARSAVGWSGSCQRRADATNKLAVRHNRRTTLIDQTRLRRFIAAMPKAELHLHIEGTLEPEMMMALAR
jgi:hypothetical protein